MKIHPIDYVKAWLKRPIQLGLDQDKDVLRSLVEELEYFYDNLDQPIAWAKINDRGDLYDLRLQNNPYDDQTKIIPLYRIKS